MKKHYETIFLEFLLFTEDAVRCSNVYKKGDSIAEDIF